MVGTDHLDVGLGGTVVGVSHWSFASLGERRPKPRPHVGFCRARCLYGRWDGAQHLSGSSRMFRAVEKWLCFHSVREEGGAIPSCCLRV